MSPLFFSSYLPSPSGQAAVNEILVRSWNSFVRWRCHLTPLPFTCLPLSTPMFLYSFFLPFFFFFLFFFFHSTVSASRYLSISPTATPLYATRGWPQSSGVQGGKRRFAYVAGSEEGRWLKWGGVQSDYAKLCPYVLAWKFHPSPSLPPRLGKCIYCCLSSVLYMATGGENASTRERVKGRRRESPEVEVEIKKKKKLPGDHR